MHTPRPRGRTRAQVRDEFIMHEVTAHADRPGSRPQDRTQTRKYQVLPRSVRLTHIMATEPAVAAGFGKVPDRPTEPQGLEGLVW